MVKALHTEPQDLQKKNYLNFKQATTFLRSFESN